MKWVVNIPVVVWLVFIATRLWILFGFDIYLSDVHFYHEVAKAAVDQGKTVYQNIFYGYPPLSLISILPPYYFASEFSSYRLIYQLINLVFDTGVLIFLYGFLANRLQVERRNIILALVLYCGLTVFNAHYIYDRVDMFIVLCFVAALYFGTAADSWRAGLIGALGLMWKVIPVIWLPVICLVKAYQRGFKGFLIAGATAFILPMVVLNIYDTSVGGKMWSMLSLHSNRGIQIESLWATPYMVKKAWGGAADLKVENTDGAQHLSPSALPGWYSSAAKSVGFLLLAGFYLYLAQVLLADRKNRFAKELPLLLFYSLAMTILLFMTFQRVLSTTFFVWLPPILAVLYAQSRRIWWPALGIIIGALTYWGFDIGYWDYVKFDQKIVMVYTARNLFLLALTILFFIEFKKFLSGRRK